MPVQDINTGYKPEFGLGALYSGWNAGTRMRSNEEEILQQLLANRQKQQEMPYDLDIKRYEGALANAKRLSPNYIPEALRGYIGQMQSQQAAGTGAMQTMQGKVDAVNAENANSTGENVLNKMIRDIQTGQGGNIGFGKFGSARMEGDGNLGLYQDVMNNPDITPEQRMLIEQDAQKSGMLNKSQGLLDKFMSAAVNTPKHQQALALGEQRGNFGLANTQMRSQAQIEAMRERVARMNIKDPTESQRRAYALAVYSGQIQGDVEAADRYLQMQTYMDVQKSGTNQKPGGYDLSEQTGLTREPSVANRTVRPPAYNPNTQAAIREQGIQQRQARTKGRVVGSGTKEDPYRQE